MTEQERIAAARAALIARLGMLPPGSVSSTPPGALPASHPDVLAWREQQARCARSQAEYDAWLAGQG